MVKLFKQSPDKYKGDMIVHFVRQEDSGTPCCHDQRMQAIIDRVFVSGDFIAKEGQVLLYYPDREYQQRVKRVLTVGLGKGDLSRETFRNAGGIVAGEARKTKTQNLLLIVPEWLSFDLAQMVECLTEGLILGNYRFRKYQTVKDEEESCGLTNIFIFAERCPEVSHGLKRGKIAAVASCMARDMGNEPANFWTPSHFAAFAQRLADQYGFGIQILSRAEMVQEKLGGILGVSSGSDQPPTMIVMEYRTGKKVPTLLFVGKGLTFDSGGISLKPFKGMEEMKYDMCGGAVMLSFLAALGEERPRHLDVVVILPATENLPGSAALKPGDVIVQHGGKTVEVISTDAEGRLILADALSYGIKRYQPAAVVDVATLTGAVIIGLGHHRTGLFSNNDELAQKILYAGERSGEPCWRLPLGPEYTKQLKSEVADLKNSVGRDGGSITAASFLAEFVGITPWAHLDIAGTAWDFTEKSYVSKGASGVGVRILLEMIRAR